MAALPGSGLTTTKDPNDATERGVGSLLPSEVLFSEFPHGLVLVAGQGRVLDLNGRARDLLALPERQAGEGEGTCCELICELVSNQVEAAGHVCLTRRALDAGSPLPEVRIDVEKHEGPRAVWVIAAPIAEGPCVIFHVRPGAAGDRRRRMAGDWGGAAEPMLRIHTLGQVRIEAERGSLGGRWLEQRAGQLLKYLVCTRHRAMASDEIAEALWPGAGETGSNVVRHYVHVLRSRLEPERQRRATSRVVRARPGGYVLESDHLWIDADEFDHGVQVGLQLFVQGEGPGAAVRLERALSLYGGDFLAEEPYAEWAFGERERLRDLAARGLRALVKLKVAGDELQAATDYARRLADMEPFDIDVQRDFMELCVIRGRRTEAMRRYELVRRRMIREFGEEPDFQLADLGG
jgi:DNA-binding SARP family transcriptional activator